MNEDVVFTVQNIKSIGLSQYHKYVSDVLIDRKVSIHHPIREMIWLYLSVNFLKEFLRPSNKLPAFKSDCKSQHFCFASNLEDHAPAHGNYNSMNT